MRELVSVVIPTFNRPFEVLERAIQSVQSQTYSNIEVIVVDDNGDKQPALSETIKNGLEKCRGVIYIRHDVNKGACAARNTGILHSHGTFVAFLDDDDFWDREKIEKQVENFDEDVGLVYCGISFFFEKGNKTINKRAVTKKHPVKSLLFKNYIGTTSCGVVRKSVALSVGGFDTGLKSGQDLDFWIRVASVSKIKEVPDCLVKYTLYSKNTITSNFRNRLESNIYLRKKYKKTIDKSLLLRIAFRGKVFKAYLKNGMHKKALGLLLPWNNYAK